MKIATWPTAIALSLLIQTATASVDSNVISVERYLEQVKKENQAYVSYSKTAAGSDLRKDESRISLTPSFFSNLTYSDDRAYPTLALPGFTYASLQTSNISAGVQQNFSFGLQTKFAYNFYSTNYVNLAPLWRVVQPRLDLTYPLWSGGFGRTLRARSAAIEATALANHYQNLYNAKIVLQDAEINYWKLAISKQTYKLQKKSVETAERLFQWNQSRVNRHLADKADLLQAEGFLAMKQLDLESATNDMRVNSQAFNASRNINSTEVVEDLPEVSLNFLDDLKIKETKLVDRDDVQAARNQIQATQSNVIQAAEVTKPTLNLLLSGWLNGRDNGSSTSIDAWSDQFAANRPSWSASVQFSVPLDLSARSNSVEGYTMERDAADTLLERKTFDAEQTWLDLSRKLVEAKRRLALATKSEAVQTERAKHERDRLTQARTTTFQVVQADSDLSNSQLGRLRVQLEILTLVAQLKLYQ